MLRVSRPDSRSRPCITRPILGGSDGQRTTTGTAPGPGRSPRGRVARGPRPPARRGLPDARQHQRRRGRGPGGLRPADARRPGADRRRSRVAGGRRDPAVPRPATVGAGAPRGIRRPVAARAPDRASGRRAGPCRPRDPRRQRAHGAPGRAGTSQPGGARRLCAPRRVRVPLRGRRRDRRPIARGVPAIGEPRAASHRVGDEPGTLRGGSRRAAPGCRALHRRRLERRRGRAAGGPGSRRRGMGRLGRPPRRRAERPSCWTR